MLIHKLYCIVKKLYLEIVKDEIPALSAQVTYYLVLSFFPFLIFLVTLVSYTNISNEEYLVILTNILPNSIYLMIIDIIKNVEATGSKAFISIGMLFTVWSASSGILALIHGINKAYGHKSKRSFLKAHIAAIIFTILLSIIIIASMLLVVLGDTIGNYLIHYFKLNNNLYLFWNISRYILALFMIFITLLIFYYYMPDKSLHINAFSYKTDIKNAIPGSIFSTIFWIILSIGFSFYINNFTSYNITYGSIGTVIVLLIWLYWTSFVFLAGAELNSILLKSS